MAVPSVPPRNPYTNDIGNDLAATSGTGIPPRKPLASTTGTGTPPRNPYTTGTGTPPRDAYAATSGSGTPPRNPYHNVAAVRYFQTV